MRIHVSTEDNLDHAIADNRRPGTEFVLSAGIHWTRGTWAHGANWERMLAPGCSILPKDGPWTIKLHPEAPRSLDGNPRPEKDVRAFTAGEGFRMVGGRIDGNQADLPDVRVTSALRAFWGETEDMAFCGCRGDYGAQVEAFPVSFHGPGASKMKGKTLIEDCASNAYVSAINFGHVGGAGMTEVESVGVDIGNGNWFAFGVNERVRIAKGEVRGRLKHLVYNDTDRTDDVCISNVVMIGGVERVLALIVKPQSPTWKGNVVLSNIAGPVLDDGAGDARIVEVWDQTNAQFLTGPVLVKDSAFTSSAPRVWAVSAVTGSRAPLVVATSEIPARAAVNGPGTVLNCIHT